MCKVGLKPVSFFLMTLLLRSGYSLKMEKDDIAVHPNVTARCPLPRACDVDGYKDWYRVGSTCVKYFANPLNFTDAEFSCRTKAPGGHLVSVHDKKANGDLLCIVISHSPNNLRIWLGGFELFQSGEFLWSDGSFWDYKIWTPGEPKHPFSNTEDCVEMNWSHVGMWNDDSCSIKKNYICAFKRKGDLW